MTSNTQIKKYRDTLKLFADENSLVHDYALKETICLMEDLIGQANERVDKKIEDKKVIGFAAKAAKHLTDYEWNHYNSSTIAHLELFLHAISSVLHVLSRCVEMLDTDTRVSMYKSVSKFWTVYKNTNYINANIMFRLREIRTSLRKIKDDQSYISVAATTGGKIIETVVNVVQNEYFAAIATVVGALDFEYSAGIWHDDWEDMHENYHTLRKQSLGNNQDLTEIKKFSRKLLRLSIKEHERVKKKNTTYRNIEYKFFKRGGGLLGYSLPDNIDTLLIGYLHIIQQIIEDFSSQMERYIKKIIPFCNEIVNNNVKKQITFKAVEILYVIRGKTKEEEIKNEIDLNFETWSNLSNTQTTQASVNSSLRPLSFYSIPDTTILSIEEKQEKRNRRFSFPNKIKTTFSNSQKDYRKQIVEAVIKLFEERRKIWEDIEETRAEHSKLLKNNTIEEDSILSKLKDILDEKRRENERRDRVEYIRSLEYKPIISKLKEMIDDTDNTNIIKNNNDKNSIDSINNTNVVDKNINNIDNTNVTENIDNIDNTNVAEKNIDDNIDKTNVTKDDANHTNITEEDVDNTNIVEENLDNTDNANIAEENLDDADDVNIVEENLDNTDNANIVEENLDDADDANIVEEGTNDIDNANIVEENPDDADDANIVEEDINDIDNANIAEEDTNDTDNVNIAEEDTNDTDNVNIAEEDTNDTDNVNIAEEDTNDTDNVNIAEENIDDAGAIMDIFDVDIMLGHQNYLDDVIISDNAVVDDVNDVNNVNDVSDVNDVKDLPIISQNSDELYLDNYEANEEEINLPIVITDDQPPPPPYSKYDDEKLIELKKSLPSPFNEYDVDKLKTMLPSNYNTLDNITIINVIQKYEIQIQDKNNVQVTEVTEVSEETSSFLATFKKIVKEVENIVEKATKAHQAAVENEKRRRLSSNTNKPDFNEEEKEALASTLNLNAD